MPTVLRLDGFRFFFYSNEGDPREPVHVHVMRDRGEAKVWLDPARIDRSAGFDARTQRLIVRMTEDNADRIRRAWHEHFGN
jgi:hypothetical protein